MKRLHVNVGVADLDQARLGSTISASRPRMPTSWLKWRRG